MGIARQEVLQALEPEPFFRYSKHPTISFLLLDAMLQVHAVDAHRERQKAVLGEVDEVTARDLPARLDLVEGVVGLVDESHRAPCSRETIAPSLYWLDGNRSIPSKPTK